MSVTDTADDLVRRWAAARTRGGDGRLCGAAFCSCRCGRAPHDDEPHRCDCGGSWAGPPGEERVLALPPAPPGFDVATFERALLTGHDPFIAAIGATTPRRAESGPIEYQR